MSGAPVLPEAVAPAAVPPDPAPAVHRLALRVSSGVAVAGGFLMLAAAMLVVASVIGRALSSTAFGRSWGLTNVPGDFELVQMATALGVFCFLSYAQARRGNILVDTFSGTWREATRRRVDGVTDLVYAGFMGLFAWLTLIGGLEARTSHTATMVLTLPLWPVFLVCAGLAALVCLVSLATAWERFASAGSAPEPEAAP